MEMSRSNTTAMSDDIRALACAFLLAKQEFLATGKSGNNVHQKWTYAKIEDIYHAVEEPLLKNNIIIWHYVRPDANVEYIVTRLVHTLTGQFIEDVRILESEKPGNQAKGAANTYMRKYAVLCLCSIPTEDDDGEEEEKHIEKRSHISDEQVQYLLEQMNSAKNGEWLYEKIKSFNKGKDIEELKATDFESTKSFIANNRK